MNDFRNLPVRIRTSLSRLKPVARRRGIKLEQTSEIRRSSSALKEQISDVDDGGKSQVRNGKHSNPVHNKELDLPVDDPLQPSIDLKRRPRGLIRKIKNIPGAIRAWWLLIHPPLTPEQQEEADILAHKKELDKLCAKEVRKYSRIIREKLWQLGEREIVRTGQEAKPKKKYVLFDSYARDEDFNKIFLRINSDPRFLPSYVRLVDLVRDENIAHEFLPTLGHPVSLNSDEAGFFVTIYRHGLDGLPEWVPAEEFWKKFQIPTMPMLAIPVGMGDNSSKKWIDLEDAENLIVSGGTGWGKSIFVNNVLSFWLWRGLKPADLEFVLFDLKRNLEFGFYENLPHLHKDEVIETGIIGDLGGVLPALDRLIVIRDQRMDQLRRFKCKNIQEFNRRAKHGQKMPYIVVAIDEWAKIRLTRTMEGLRYSVNAVMGLAQTAASMIIDGNDEERGVLEILMGFAKSVIKLRNTSNFGEEAENKLVELSSQGRAVGLHFILATQNPLKEVLTGLITVNFHSRVVYHSNIGGSLAALGTQSAKSLTTKGRCILLHKGEEGEFQTPFVPESLIRSVVHMAITGKKLGTNPVDFEEILQYALDHMDGLLNVSKLYEAFREKRVRSNWLKEQLQNNELGKFVLGGKVYEITRRGQNAPRRLRPVEG